MPTYEYQCDACEHSFEEFQSFSDKPLTKCPQCGKRKLRRLIGTGAAILFKGSGFYQTDYRSESYTSAAMAEEAAAKSSGSTPSKSDTASTNDAAATPAAPSAESGAAPPGKKSKSRK